MSFDKVAWSEGMFISAQHFQQSERYIEWLVRHRTIGLRSHGWGLLELRQNKELLSIGRFGIEHASGVLPDGTPFVIPASEDELPPITLDETVRDCIIYLTLPISNPGGREIADQTTSTISRYTTKELEIADNTNDDITTLPIIVGKQRLRYSLETSDRSGFVSIGLARVIEVRADNSVVLDPSYIPPMLDCQNNTTLSGFIVEIVGMLNNRSVAIADRLAGSSTGTAADITDAMLLQAINRCQPLFTHMASSALVHPEELYKTTISLAGELSTFTTSERRPGRFPAYNHAQLSLTFQPVMAALRQSFSTVLEHSAIAVALTEHLYGIRVAEVPDRALYFKGSFIIAAKADMAVDTLANKLVGQIKIGPVEQISELVNTALSGVRLRFLPTAPRQIPYHSGKVYFELDHTSPVWAQIARGAGMAIHVAGDLPGLELELWVVKNQGDKY